MVCARLMHKKNTSKDCDNRDNNNNNNAGGRGLIQLEVSYKTTTIGLDTYLKNTDDALIELVQEHDGRKKLYSIQRQAEQFKQELDLTTPDKQAEETTTKYAKRIKQMARNKTQEKLTKQWVGGQSPTWKIPKENKGSRC